ncbi:MAG: hypothetical protein DYH12_31785, partial [Sorangiineae bacterium PRO1]|nr:hypothetical protein [Sorangiineae bacterium PRO1]
MARRVLSVCSGLVLLSIVACATGEADLGGGLPDAGVGGYKSSGGSSATGGAAGFPSGGAAGS